MSANPKLDAFRRQRLLDRMRHSRATTAALAGPTPIEGVVAVEGTPTGDGRMMDRRSLRWTDDPIPIIWDPDDNDHDGRVIGTFTRLRRRRDGSIFGNGALSETDDPDTAKLVTRAEELVRDGAIQFSVRLDEVDRELRMSAEAWDRMQQEIERMFDPDAEPEDEEQDADGRRILDRSAHDDVLDVVTDARIRHVAMVDTAAFIDARPEALQARIASADPEEPPETVAFVTSRTFDVGDDLTVEVTTDWQFPCPKPWDTHEECVDDMEEEVDDADAFCAAWAVACDEALTDDTVEAVLAAANVPTLPATHFARFEPEDAPSPLTVDPDGRIWGHVADRYTCHRSGRAGCMTYRGDVDPTMRGFHTSTPITLDDGSKVRVGTITLGGNHADTSMSRNERRAHHESASRVGALVTAWEDKHGLAVSGHVVDGLSKREMQQLVGTAPSVELWPEAGGLTLLGIHMVPTPAWPVAAAADEGPVVLVEGPCCDGSKPCPDCGRDPAIVDASTIGA